MTRCSFTWPLGRMLLIVLLCPPVALRPQTNSSPTRIQPEPGGPAVTLDGDVEKGREVFFVFQANAGLKFNGHLTTKSGKAGFAVDGADGKGLPEEEFDFNTDR
jgi:hypothetical protein